MKKRRNLKDLTIRDNFMFAAVMTEAPDICREVLEYALGIHIDRIEVAAEKTILYHPEFRGIRLDVYARDMDADGNAVRHFDVEMQVVNREIFRRSRYYHSQMDMELLGKGVPYDELPDAFVVFICDFDPVGLGKYRYTLRHTLEEDNSYDYYDGSHTVYLSTKGNNRDEVPCSLVEFLDYVGTGLEDCSKEFGDTLVRRIQESVKKIKADREMGARYMLFEEMLKDEFNEGKLEGRLEGKLEGRLEGKLEEKKNVIISFLSDIAEVPESLKDKLDGITDEEELGILIKKAARVSGIEEFEEELDGQFITAKAASRE